MPSAAPRPWTVVPPVTLEKLEDNLWCIDGPVPTIPGLNRRMSIVKLSDGRLVFHNAVPMEDAQAQEISAWGKPAFLIIPSGGHKTDAHPFSKRFGLKVLCPPVAKAQVSTLVDVEGDLSLLPRDPALEAFPVEGAKNGEHALIVHHSGGRATVILCDAIANMPNGPGVRGLLFRLLGFTGPEPKVTTIWKRRALADKSALKGSLEKIAATPGLSRGVPSHGAIFTQDPSGALRRAASRL